MPVRLSGRYLAHSTQFYHAILEASCHPSLMRTPGERDCRIQGECVRLSLVLSELNEKMLRNGIRTCRPATGEGKSWYELALEAAEEIAGRARNGACGGNAAAAERDDGR